MTDEKDKKPDDQPVEDLDLRDTSHSQPLRSNLRRVKNKGLLGWLREDK